MTESQEGNLCGKLCPKQADCNKMIQLCDALIEEAERNAFATDMEWQLRSGETGPTRKEQVLSSAFEATADVLRESRQRAEKVLAETALMQCSGRAIMQDEDGVVRTVCRAGMDPLPKKSAG